MVTSKLSATDSCSVGGSVRAAQALCCRHRPKSAITGQELAGHDARLGALLFPPRRNDAGRRCPGRSFSGRCGRCVAGVFREYRCRSRFRACTGPRDRDQGTRTGDCLFVGLPSRAPDSARPSEGIAVSAPSLHRLLWGPPAESTPLSQWTIRPWEIPAVGLPVRVATHLFRSARCCGPPDDWTLTRGPLTWRLSGPDTLLAPGRRFQLGLSGSLPPASTPSGRSEVRRSSEWDVPPHAAYYRPTLVAGTRNVHPVSYVLFCDVLLLLTALDGGEALLDSLVDRGTGDVPFEDRWDWRSRIHLPRKAWHQIRSSVPCAGRRAR